MKDRPFNYSLREKILDTFGSTAMDTSDPDVLDRTIHLIFDELGAKRPEEPQRFKIHFRRSPQALQRFLKELVLHETATTLDELHSYFTTEATDQPVGHDRKIMRADESRRLGYFPYLFQKARSDLVSAPPDYLRWLTDYIDYPPGTDTHKLANAIDKLGETTKRHVKATITRLLQ